MMAVNRDTRAICVTQVVKKKKIVKISVMDIVQIIFLAIHQMDIALMGVRQDMWEHFATIRVFPEPMDLIVNKIVQLSALRIYVTMLTDRALA